MIGFFKRKETRFLGFFYTSLMGMGICIARTIIGEFEDGDKVGAENISLPVTCPRTCLFRLRHHAVVRNALHYNPCLNIRTSLFP